MFIILRSSSSYISHFYLFVLVFTSWFLVFNDGFRFPSPTKLPLHGFTTHNENIAIRLKHSKLVCYAVANLQRSKSKIKIPKVNPQLFPNASENLSQQSNTSLLVSVSVPVSRASSARQFTKTWKSKFQHLEPFPTSGVNSKTIQAKIIPIVQILFDVRNHSLTPQEFVYNMKLMEKLNIKWDYLPNTLQSIILDQFPRDVDRLNETECFSLFFSMNRISLRSSATKIFHTLNNLFIKVIQLLDTSRNISVITDFACEIGIFQRCEINTNQSNILQQLIPLVELDSNRLNLINLSKIATMLFSWGKFGIQWTSLPQTTRNNLTQQIDSLLQIDPNEDKNIKSLSTLLVGFRLMGYDLLRHSTTMKDAFFLKLANQSREVPWNSLQFSSLLYELGELNLRWDSLPKPLQNMFFHGMNTCRWDRDGHLCLSLRNVFIGFENLQLNWTELSSSEQDILRNLTKTFIGRSQNSYNNTAVITNFSAKVGYLWQNDAKIRDVLYDTMVRNLNRSKGRNINEVLHDILQDLLRFKIEWIDLSEKLRTTFISFLRSISKQIRRSQVLRLFSALADIKWNWNNLTTSEQSIVKDLSISRLKLKNKPLSLIDLNRLLEHWMQIRFPWYQEPEILNHLFVMLQKVLGNTSSKGKEQPPVPVLERVIAEILSKVNSSSIPDTLRQLMAKGLDPRNMTPIMMHSIHEKVGIVNASVKSSTDSPNKITRTKWNQKAKEQEIIQQMKNSTFPSNPSSPTKRTKPDRQTIQSTPTVSLSPQLSSPTSPTSLAKSHDLLTVLLELAENEQTAVQLKSFITEAMVSDLQKNRLHLKKEFAVHCLYLLTLLCFDQPGLTSMTIRNSTNLDNDSAPSQSLSKQDRLLIEMMKIFYQRITLHSRRDFRSPSMTAKFGTFLCYLETLPIPIQSMILGDNPKPIPVMVRISNETQTSFMQSTLFHHTKKIAQSLSQRIGQFILVQQDFDGLGRGIFPMDIVIFKGKEIIGFIEVDGTHHYREIHEEGGKQRGGDGNDEGNVVDDLDFIPDDSGKLGLLSLSSPSSSSSSKKESPIKKLFILRRKDRLKEYFYSFRFPNIPVVRISLRRNSGLIKYRKQIANGLESLVIKSISTTTPSSSLL